MLRRRRPFRLQQAQDRKLARAAVRGRAPGEPGIGPTTSGPCSSAAPHPPPSPPLLPGSDIIQDTHITFAHGGRCDFRGEDGLGTTLPPQAW